MNRKPSPITRLKVICSLASDNAKPAFGYTSRSAQLFTAVELEVLEKAGFISHLPWGWLINKELLDRACVDQDPIDSDDLRRQFLIIVERYGFCAELVDDLVSAVLEADKKGEIPEGGQENGRAEREK